MYSPTYSMFLVVVNMLWDVMCFLVLAVLLSIACVVPRGSDVEAALCGETLQEKQQALTIASHELQVQGLTQAVWCRLFLLWEPAAWL